MHDSILFVLIYNAALLIALAYIYGLLSVYEKEQTPLWRKLVPGGVVSAIGLSIMLPTLLGALSFTCGVWIPFFLLYPAAIILILGRAARVQGLWRSLRSRLRSASRSAPQIKAASPKWPAVEPSARRRTIR